MRVRGCNVTEFSFCYKRYGLGKGPMMKKEVTPLRAQVDCQTCGWIWESENSYPALGQACRHARRYGHKVRVYCESYVFFDGESDIPNLQLDFLQSAAQGGD